MTVGNLKTAHSIINRISPHIPGRTEKMNMVNQHDLTDTQRTDAQHHRSIHFFQIRTAHFQR